MTHVAPSSHRELTVSASRRGDVAVLTLSGGLDPSRPVESGLGVEAALRSVDAALASGPRLVVADLTAAEVTRFLVGMLGLVRRRTARTGVPLVLAGLSAAGHGVFDHSRVSALYRTFPTVPAALGAGTVRTVSA